MTLTRWREHAACADPLIEPSLFDVELGQHIAHQRPRMIEAAQICESCPVTDTCLIDALATHAVEVIRAGRVFGVDRGTPPTVAEYLTGRTRPVDGSHRGCARLGCANEFTPLRDRHRYCSQECRYTDTRKLPPEPPERECEAPRCDTTFRSYAGMYCSTRCKQRVYDERKRRVA